MIVFLLLLLLPLAKTESCAYLGEWGEWSEWTGCPKDTSSMMNFRTRIRTCQQRPAGCTVTTSYVCPGTYSEVTYCESGTTREPAAQPPPATTSPPPSPTRPPAVVPTIVTSPPSLSTILTTTLATSTTTPTPETSTTEAFEETTEDLQQETDTSRTPSTRVNQGITFPTGRDTTTWDDTTISDLSERTEPMGTMPTESSPAMTQEPATGISAAEEIGETDTTAYSDVSKETTDMEGPVITDVPEGTTDIMVTETRGISDGPEGTTDMEMSESPAVSEPYEESTELMETTTAKATCDDCMELNVHLYDEDPYEDGASVLNRYSRQGCKHVQFFCRSFQMDDFRPVRTVFNTNLSITDLPLSVEVLCKNGQWWYEKVAVNSLSCIYEPPPTTTAMTTWAPGDPNSPCMQCGQDLYVKPGSSKVEGAVYVDYRADRCLSAQLYCQPTKPHHFVDIYHDNAPMGIHGTSLNRTFHCNYDSQWVEVNTATIIGNVSCVMEKGPPSSTHMMESTTEAGETIYTTDEGMSSVDLIETRIPTTSPWEEDWSTTSGYGGEETVSTTVNGRFTTSPVETTTEATTDVGESMTPIWTDASEAVTLPTSLEPVEEITTATVESVDTSTAMETSTIESISDTETTEGERTSTTKMMSTMTTRYETTTETDFEGISSTEVGTTELPPLQPEGSTTEEITSGTTQLWESSTSEEVPANSQASTSRENTQGSTSVFESTSVETTQIQEISETSQIIDESTPAGELGSTGLTTDSPRSSQGSTIVTPPPYPVYQSSTTKTRTESSTAAAVTSTSTTEPLTPESTEDITTSDNLEETSTGPSSQTTAPVTITQRNTVASTLNTSPNGENPSSLPTTTMEQTTDLELSTSGDFETSTSIASKRTTPIWTTADPGYIEPSPGTTSMPTSTDSETDMITPSTDFETMTPTLATTSATHESRPSEGPLPTTITTEKTPDTSESELFTETSASARTTTTQEPPQEATTTLTSADPSTDEFISSSESFTESVFTPRPAERPSTRPSIETTEMDTYESTVLITATSASTLPDTMSTTTTMTAPMTVESTTTVITTTRAPLPTSTTVLRTPLDPGNCHLCRNMAAALMNRPDSYDGMMVLDHTVDNKGCRLVKVDCVPTTADENTTIFINGETAVATGVGSRLTSFSCNRDGKWIISDGVLVTNVSCSVQRKIDEEYPYPESTTVPTTTTTTTARPPGVEPCMSCPQLSVIPVGTGYRNGFTTLLSSTNGRCKTIELSCEGSNPDDDLALVISGTVFEQGIGALKTNLTCNDMMTWTTANGYAVPLVSCAIKIATTTTTTRVPTTITMPSTTTTTTSTTVTTTTTPTPSLCNECANLQPVPVSQSDSTGQEYANGQLILDHYTDFSRCRVVVIKCSADSNYENATILFNGNIVVASAPSRIATSLTCDEGGNWMRLQDAITSTSCRVTRKSSTATEPPFTTTTIASTTTTEMGSAPCSNCNRMLVTSVPPGYTNGFLTMNTFYTGACINVDLSCSAPDLVSEVALISSSGQELIRVESRANISLSCNDQATWVSPSNVTVDNLSCAVATATTTSTTTTREITTPSAEVTTGPSCSLSTWAEWREWSKCSDTCGSCGTRQRFRACNKARPDCLCEGTAYEKEVCNRAVCKYPRPAACCTGYTAASYQSQFYCMKTVSRPVVV
ncbi:hypothetical protein V3C99_014782 [Haemonchus contortus]